MQFIGTTVKTAATDLKDRLQAALDKGHKVLWLTSGGSNIVISANILRGLKNTRHLTIAQVDERYGPVGHPDSNWQQLLDSGAPLEGITLLPILENPLASMNATAESYEAKLKSALSKADVSIAQLGMGADGHIAGILPETDAVTAPGLVVAYQTPQHDRITLTFKGLNQIQELYLFAYGHDKTEQLERLESKDVPESEQPAQYLKRHGHVIVYNDSIGGNAE